MSVEERAFIIASVMVRVDSEQKEIEKAKRSSKK
jgi:hypothetical protein